MSTEPHPCIPHCRDFGCGDPTNPDCMLKPHATDLQAQLTAALERERELTVERDKWLAMDVVDVRGRKELRAKVSAMDAVVSAARLMSATLVELSLACEVYFDTDTPLPDHDAIDGALVHAYRDQNNWRDAVHVLDHTGDDS